MSNAALPAIQPLVDRHAGDAAFYWSQHDGSAHSPLIDLENLRQIDRLLRAHLDGLIVADDTGWQIALQNLERWRGPGEAFVCAYLGLVAVDQTRMSCVTDLVVRAPARMLRGLISALAWAEPAASRPWIERLLEPAGAAALRVAALRAARLIGEGAVTIIVPRLAAALEANDSNVRAAACRLAGRIGEVDRVRAGLADPDPVVRAEAALALAAHDRPAAQPVLWQSTMVLAAQGRTLGGLPRSRAERRLARWVRKLAVLMPIGEPGVAQLLAQLPPRLALLLLLHHGDAAYLHWIVGRMNGSDTARLAGWVWQSLTGIGLEANELAFAPRALQDDEPVRPTDDLDAGLPEADASRVAAVGLDVPTSVPCLLGAPLDAQRARHLLHHGPQALRWHGAEYLAREHGLHVDTRAPALRQLAQLRALDAALDSRTRVS